MPPLSQQYVWFDDVRVASDEEMGLHCIVNEWKVPLPVTILHPECTLRKPGDVGRLGVPMAWAVGWGMIAKPSPQSARREST